MLQIFLGQLREAEIERINDRISQAVMETCLAMTIFRDEFNVEFVAMFTILTFIKVFHWLVQDRVDFIETTPSVSRLHHFRIVSFMCLLLVSQLISITGYLLLVPPHLTQRLTPRFVNYQTSRFESRGKEHAPVFHAMASLERHLQDVGRALVKPPKHIWKAKVFPAYHLCSPGMVST